MNQMNEALAIVNELDDIFSESPLSENHTFTTEHLLFTTEIYCGGFNINIIETNETGAKYPLFNSEMNFHESIELKYENDEYSYKEAVLEQILMNLQDIESFIGNIKNHFMLRLIKG